MTKSDEGNAHTRIGRLGGAPLKSVLLSLSVLLALCSGIAFAASDDSPSRESNEAALSAPPGEAEGVELEGERTATSETFLQPDGERETRIFSAPINYRDGDGDWVPIHADLVESEEGGATNGSNSFDLNLPARLGVGPVRLSVGGAWVSERLLGDRTEVAELDGESASYDSNGSDTSFQLSTLSNGLKENIEIAGPSEPSTFRFELDASSGLTPSKADDGSIEFRDQDGQPVVTLPAPFMSDGSPDSQVSQAVHFELAPQNEGVWVLTVEADRDWLQSPERTWPATIDPTITVPGASTDCTIRSWESESNTCGIPSGYAFIGATALSKPNSAEDQISRSLVKFNLSAIPVKSWVTGAEVSLYSPAPAENTEGIELRRATTEWSSNGLSWKKARPGTYWTTPGGDFNTTGGSLSTADRGGGAPGWWNVDSQGLATLVDGWVNGTYPNYGVMLKLLDEKNHNCSPTCINRQIGFWSSAQSPKPTLTVTYTTPAPAGSKVTSPREGTVTAKRLKLAAAWTHQGVTGVTFQYRDEDEGWIDVPPAKVNDISGQALSAWPYAVEGGAQQSKALSWDLSALNLPATGAKLPVRAVLAGAQNAGGHTETVVVEVNRNKGGPKDAVTPLGPGGLDLLTGNLTLSRTDVQIPGFSALNFARTHMSREAKAQPTGPLGPGWVPSAPLEEAGAGAFSSIRDISEAVEYEDEEGSVESVKFDYAVLTDVQGRRVGFEKTPAGLYVAPAEVTGWLLERQSATQLALTDPSGTRTVFSNNGSGNEYLPASVSRAGGSTNQAKYNYDIVEGKRWLKEVVAPSAPEINCQVGSASATVGCHVLKFNYGAPSEWGGQAGMGKRLTSITYFAATGETTMGQWTVASYSYDPQGQLVAAWDPRISPALKETYAYNANGQITTVTPPGQQPWTLEYAAIPGDSAGVRLTAVSRPGLPIAPNNVARTTIGYDVPLDGSKGSYAMTPSAVSQWGQKDHPADATAVFPPDQVPASPPSSYQPATIYYMDAEGQAVNTATPAGAGTGAPSITTTETDEFGNVVRELTAQNRLRAVAAGSGSVAKSEELETKRKYSPDGTELWEEWGPAHQISGAGAPARLHRILQYENPSPPAGFPAYHLVTRETAGASIKGKGVDEDQRVTEYGYNWPLRKQTETVVDPGSGHLAIRSRTTYDSETGLPTEQRQPSDEGGTGAGTTRTVYYRPDGATPECKSYRYAALPCKILPAAQTSGSGRPQLVVRKIAAYNALGLATDIRESPGEEVFTRQTVVIYDPAGRLVSVSQSGGGTPVPKSETLYSSTTGLPITQRFKCEVSCAGFDDQALTATYDTLGRLTSYQDADGNTATTTYDLLGRPVSTDDGKGTQTRIYDATTGLLTELQDSAAGTFTASYNADGAIVEQGFPNGMVGKSTYDETGSPTHLSYVKTTMCSVNCTWLDFNSEESIHGQVLAQTGTLSTQQYSYDKAGRLKQTLDTLQGGSCVTRSYSFDADSNRTKLITRAPGLGGACDTTSTGTVQNYSYDGADRLFDTGLTYDNFGRITSLPATYAGGGGALTTSYFSNDMVASQSQGGITNTFQLDALASIHRFTTPIRPLPA